VTDPFADGLDALYWGPASAEATYTPASGISATVRIIREQEDEDTGMRGNRKMQHANMFSVRRSEVVEPAAGASLEIAGDRFELVGEPTIDTEGLSWRFGAMPKS
jgi:hypothetical protein